MLTGELRNQIDRIWDSFWSGGIANPIEVIEQITYLLFLKRLDDEQTREDRKADTLNQPVERRIFPDGADARGTSYQHMRWRYFKDLEPRAMFEIVGEHVFPFLRAMGGDDSTYAHHMRDARFTIPTPALLAKAVDLIDKLQMDDRDTKGDVYEYMLGKIASAGQKRAVPHAAAHHPADGAAHSAGPGRCGVRPGLGHMRLYARRALESALQWAYKSDSKLKLPYQENLWRSGRTC